MKRYLRLLLPLIVVVFLAVAGCGGSGSVPEAEDTAANPALIPDMPVDPQSVPAAEAAPAEAAP